MHQEFARVPNGFRSYLASPDLTLSIPSLIHNGGLAKNELAKSRPTVNYFTDTSSVKGLRMCMFMKLPLFSVRVHMAGQWCEALGRFAFILPPKCNCCCLLVTAHKR